MKKAIIWFRSDLRIHDNEAFIDAIHCASEVYPVYVFDHRVFNGRTSFGFKKTGVHRARFIIESVIDLKQQLRSLGSDLIIKRGKPEIEIFQLAKSLKTSWIFCNRERTDEEVWVQDELEKNLWSIGQEVRFSRGKMLYYTADLPFPITHAPDIFTHFRKEVEKITPIRKPLPTISANLNPISIEFLSDPVPGLRDFGHQDEYDSFYRGGETVGLARLKEYIWQTDAIKDYKKNRKKISGINYSSKLSPWISQGCLSTKTFYWEIKKYEEQYGLSDSSYSLFLDLIGRDFFRLMGKKHGNKIFQITGVTGRHKPWSDNWKIFEKWVMGKIGVPIIDACMRELNRTGYLSHQGRKLVASYLIHELNINWIMGAEYFESVLLDYDPCSNYGNWAHLAGVDSNPRPNNHANNILAQAKKIDLNGDYVRYWIPELSGLSGWQIHAPDQLKESQLVESGIVLGETYPFPVINSQISIP